MKTQIWRILVLACWATLLSPAARAATIDFSDLPLAPNSYYSGSPGGMPLDGSYGAPFTSGGMTFFNEYVVSFGGTFTYVDGWANSNMVVSPPTAGTYGSNFQTQYQFSVPGGSSGNYGLTFLSNSDLVLPAGTRPTSMQVNNLTYVYLSLRDGDGFAKKFGGVSGNDEDFFQLTIHGLTAGNTPTGSVSVYLADFLGSNTTIVSDWLTVDLTPLGNAAKLSFSLQSSDNHPTFGINTPTAFAMDNLVVTAIPEPGTWAMLLSVGTTAIVFLRRRRVS